MEYSNEELNFFRICYITTNIITEGLRSVFKQEWNTRYQALLGDWQDTAKNGVDFDNQETPASKKKNKRLLTTMKNGNSKEWDCTALFFGILYSNSIGASLNTAIFNHVDNIRLFRNEVFAHVVEGRISNIDFQHLVGVVETAFTGLNLAVDAIRAIANQNDFPTEEVKNLKKDMQALQEERDALEEKSVALEQKSAVLEVKSAALEEKSAALEEELKATPKSFLGALPMKPSHVIQKRVEEVSRIIKQLKDLSENSDGEVRTVYISGNPGCGKSQLAREVGEEAFRQESSANTFFVASINAATQDEMVISYSGLARQLGCTEYAVSRISTSKEFTVEQKLEQLNSLIAPKTRAFPSWLLIVDGVVDLTDVRKYWPASGSKEYGAGNVIVTTQDQSAIPECSELSRHICLSEGMQVGDAVSLLTRISQMPDEENILSVAEALDRQPLALACAALYVQSVRSHGSPNFTWKDYLDKLDKGKEKTMGEVKKCDMGYPISMPVAVKMAVDRAICEEVLFHSFQLLSVCAPSPIPLEVVVRYVYKRTTDRENEEIRAKLTNSSLLIFDFNENTLCFHQVLHRVIKANENIYLSSEKAFEVIAAAFEPIKSMADKESTRRKIFIEHVNGFLDYVNMLHSTHTNFYGELSKFTELNSFFKWFTKCATTCLEYGKMTVVKQCLENVVSFIQENGCIEENSFVDDSLSSRLLFFCGRVLHELCDYSRALEYFNRSLNLDRKIHGGKIHGDVAACLVNLGITHDSLCHYTEAIKCHEEALTFYRELYGERNGHVAACLVNLGVINSKLSHYIEATTCLEEALSIYLELYGEKHQRVADCLLNLGAVNKELSQYEQADIFYQQALCTRREVLVGENHPTVADCLHNLGQVHLDCCRFYEAKDLFEQCLPIFSDVGDQERVGVCLHNLGRVSERLDDMETAVEFFTRALETWRRFLPENHPRVKNSVEELNKVTRNMAAAKSTNDNKPQIAEPNKTNESQEDTEENSHENEDSSSTINMAATQRCCPKCILL